VQFIGVSVYKADLCQIIRIKVLVAYYLATI